MFCKCILKCSHTAFHHNQNCGKNHTHLDVDDLPHGCVALRTVWSAGVDWTQRSAGLAPLQEERALSGALLTCQSPEKKPGGVQKREKGATLVRYVTLAESRKLLSLFVGLTVNLPEPLFSEMSSKITPLKGSSTNKFSIA